MSLRRDPATRRWVVYPESDEPPAVAGERCPFCAGNEDLTPPEIIRWNREEGTGWAVRVVPSAAPMLHIEAPLQRSADGMYDAASGTGAHEIVIETPEHLASLSQLGAGQLERVLEAYAQRIADLKRDHRIRSIFLFRNHGAMSGAALPGHAHAQIIGLPVTPKALKETLQGARAYYQYTERCVFCDMVRTELEKETRIVASSEHFLSFAPYASRHPYETWIVPREHGPDFELCSEEARRDLARLLGPLLGRMEQALPVAAYNLFLYSGPNREGFPGRWKTLDLDFHWNIQILPRPVRETGFEMGSGFYANPVTPERAAQALRERS